MSATFSTPSHGNAQAVTTPYERFLVSATFNTRSHGNLSVVRGRGGHP